MYGEFWFDVYVLACQIASRAFVDGFTMRLVQDFWGASAATLGSMPVLALWPIGLVLAFFTQIDMGDGIYGTSWSFWVLVFGSSFLALTFYWQLSQI